MINTPNSTIIGNFLAFASATQVGFGSSTVDPDAAIKALFSDGKQGVWYDPSDKSTLFQDVAGTVPVTKDGDPVGLILDKSKGLVKGVDLLTSWDFLDWQVGGAYVSRTKNSVTFNYSAGRSTMVISKELIAIGYYILEMDFTITGLGSEYFDVLLMGGRPKRLRGYATSLTMIVRDISSIEFRSNSTTNASITVNKMSLRKLDGNHSVQSISASRPVYRKDVDKSWLYNDKIDDKLLVNLPAMTATVVKATDEGVSINYPVSITAGDYPITSTSVLGRDYGYLIINKELSASEITQVTNYFNVKRGV